MRGASSPALRLLYGLALIITVTPPILQLRYAYRLLYSETSPAGPILITAAIKIAVVALVLALTAGARLTTLLRRPEALAAPGQPALLRRFAIALMMIGVVANGALVAGASVLHAWVFPLMTSQLPSLATLGLVLFETSRLFAYERG